MLVKKPQLVVIYLNSLRFEPSGIEVMPVTCLDGLLNLECLFTSCFVKFLNQLASTSLLFSRLQIAVIWCPLRPQI